MNILDMDGDGWATLLSYYDEGRHGRSLARSVNLVCTCTNMYSYERRMLVNMS